jgi:chromosome segregation ATPase
MLSQRDIDELEKRLKEIFATKEDFQSLKSDIFDKLDAFVKEVRDSHEERVIVSHKLSNHEDRIEKLEAAVN